MRALWLWALVEHGVVPESDTILMPSVLQTCTGVWATEVQAGPVMALGIVSQAIQL